MKKNYIFSLILVIFFTNTLFATTDKLNLTTHEKQYLKKHPIITAHNENNWAPFNFNKNGVAQGYSIDYMNLLASKIGIKVKYISGYSWNEYLTLLQTSKLDLIINISKNKKRIKTINFTKPFLIAKNTIFVNKKNKNYSNLNSLIGKTIAMPKDFFAQKYIEKNYPNIKQILVKDSLEALKLLSLGKVDATIGKKIVLDYLMQENLISNVIATNYIENKDMISHISIGSSKNDQILISILNKAQLLVSQEEIKKLKLKWFGDNLKYQNKNSKLNLTKKEKDYLKKKKNINMCVDPNWMPFEKIQNNKHIGISADYMKLISNMLQIPINFVNTKTWEETVKKAKNRDCDIYSIVAKTPSRNKYMNFTKPFIKTPIVIATKSKELYVDDFTKVLDKTFAVVTGYSLNVFLKDKYPSIKIIGVESIEKGLEAVANGSVFAYVDNLVTINYMIQKEFIGILNISGRIKIDIPYRIGTRNDEPILSDIFQKALDNIDESQKNNIFNKWVINENNYKVNYTLVWQIIGIFTIILSLILYFLIQQNQLKKKIEYLNHNLETKIDQTLTDLTNAQKLSKIGSWKLENNTNKLFWSDEVYRIYELDKNKNKVNNLSDFIKYIHSEDLDMVTKAFNNHIQLKEPYHIVHRIITKNNKIKWVEERCESSFHQDGNVLISNGTIQDITEKTLKDLELKQKDKMMLHQSRLAQMGEMISMIAHQWRQPLNAISLTSSNLQFKCIMDDINKDLFENELKQIDQYSQHLSKTIDDFRNFFKEDKEKELISFSKIVNDTLEIVEVSLKNKNINIITNIECEEKFETYSNELKQVLLNLIKNSEDALIENKVKYPTITIKTLCNNNCDKQTLIIQDNAGGIPPEIIEEIFKPYFSTKKEKDGTGLGLYMSKTIIEDHCKGHLSVKNDSYGAVFSIEFN